MADDTFSRTVRNLLSMKPRPREPERADKEKEGDGADRHPPASSKKAD